MGQKGRSFKHINDNQPLFENKTAEADLGGSFQIRSPENLINGFEKLDLVHDTSLINTPFVRPAIKTQNDSGIETHGDTVIHLNQSNFHSSNLRPYHSSNTKRSLYNNKENIPEQIIEELKTPESEKGSQNNTSASCTLTVEENSKEVANKSSINVKDETCCLSETLYHSIGEITAISNSPHLSFSTGNSDLPNSSLTIKQLGCNVDGQTKYSALELSPAAKRNNFVIRARSPIHPIPVGFVQDGEFKRPINSSGSICIKCANENYISVKGINYSILNTLGHGGSSIVYEVNTCL